MALRWMVIFDADDAADRAAVDQAFADCADLLRQIPGVRNFVGGPNINPNVKARRYAVTMEFDDADAMKRYAAHENHAAALAAIQPYNKSAINSLLAI
ncbi:MAG: Dabb family protein [Burkholderiaceae bacterium]